MQGVLVGVLAGFLASITVVLMQYYGVPVHVYWVILICAAAFVLVSILIVGSKWYKGSIMAGLKERQVFRPVIGKSVSALQNMFVPMTPEDIQYIEEAAKKFAKEKETGKRDGL